MIKYIVILSLLLSGCSSVKAVDGDMSFKCGDNNDLALIKRTGARVKQSYSPPFPTSPIPTEYSRGWVKLSFDILKTGGVININIVDEYPRDFFRRAAKKALKKYVFHASEIESEKGMLIIKFVLAD